MQILANSTDKKGGWSFAGDCDALERNAFACLDKVAKYQLARSDRLRFYRDYLGRDRLGARDKRRLRKVLRFFAGRE